MQFPNMTLVFEAKGEGRPYCATVFPDRTPRPAEHQETCTYCHRPMVDGGAPFPGDRSFPSPRACASCWAALTRIADALAPHYDVFPLGGLVDTRPFGPGFCHHGVALEDPCDTCDAEIEGTDDEEVID